MFVYVRSKQRSNMCTVSMQRLQLELLQCGVREYYGTLFDSDQSTFYGYMYHLPLLCKLHLPVHHMQQASLLQWKARQLSLYIRV